MSTSFNVIQATPTLSIASVADQTYNGPTVTVSATSTETGASAPTITYTVSGPATIAGNVVTTNGVGKVTVTASQAASANYAAPASVSTSFNVGQATPKLTIASVADQTYNGPSVTVSATSTETGASAPAITYAVSGPATIAGNVVTTNGVGKVTVTASQAASANYAAPASVSTSFNVGQATPTLSIASVADQTYNGPSVTVSATSTETGASAPTITYTVSGPATIAGNVVTTNGVGKVTVTASQAASANYAAPASVSTSFNVNQVTPTLTIAPIQNQTYGGPAITATATSNSPGTITYTLGSGSPATISGNSINITGAGKVTVTASQAATANYAAPASVSTSFTVGQATPTLTIAPIPDQTYGGPTVTLSTSSNSTGALTYSLTTTTGATISTSGVITTSAVGSITVNVNQASTTNYAATSASTSFKVLSASKPQITAQPVGETICLNAPLNLSVTATNATSYQWYLNGNAISGATGSSYNLGSAQASDGGNYVVVVSNSHGSINSGAAVVVVGATIVSNPASLSVSAGQTATFAVSVSGDSPFTYQWYKVGPYTTTGVLLSGATASSYTTPVTTLSDNGTNFYVAVKDACGNVQNSTAANLNVSANNFPPTITKQPASQTVAVGGTPTLSVTATGSGTLTYQWYVIPAGQTTATAVANATASTYKLPATTTLNDQDQYYAIVANSYGQAVSQNATIAVGAGIQITQQPKNVYVNPGTPATFSVTATSTSALTYQWYEAAPGSSTFNLITNATSSSYTVASPATTDNGSVFYVVVSNGGASAAVTSSSAALFVGALVNIPACSTNWNTGGMAFALTPSTTTTNTTCGYQLTAAQGVQAGQIVWPTPIGTDNLQLSFTVTTSSASTPPADGFAVVLGDPSLGANLSSLGANGQGLGAKGIPGLAFTFDDYENPGDPPVPYIGVTRGEAVSWENPYFYSDTGISALASPNQIITHSYVVTLAQGLLTISMDGVQILSGKVTPPPIAYLYVTASTGSLWEQTQITNISAAVSPAN